MSDFEKVELYKISDEQAKHLTTEAFLVSILNNKDYATPLSFETFERCMEFTENSLHIGVFLKREDSTEVIKDYIQKYKDLLQEIDEKYGLDLVNGEMSDEDYAFLENLPEEDVLYVCKIFLGVFLMEDMLIYQEITNSET